MNSAQAYYLKVNAWWTSFFFILLLLLLLLLFPLLLPLLLLLFHFVFLLCLSNNISVVWNLMIKANCISDLFQSRFSPRTGLFRRKAESGRLPRRSCVEFGCSHHIRACNLKIQKFTLSRRAILNKIAIDCSICKSQKNQRSEKIK